jgi:adenylate cyclase
VSVLRRLLTIAEQTGDDDDARLRRRVGVVAGYLTIFAPLPLVIQGQGNFLSVLLAVGMPIFTALNLVALARSRNFERYVVLMLTSGVIFVPLATWVGGGLLGTTTGLAFGFLVPAYAIMALGPHRATLWFVAFIVMGAVLVVVDPFVAEAAGPQPYPLRLFGHTLNILMPLSITFLLLRYTDVRRRAAEQRADDLLTNAIPRAIATRLRRGEARIADAYPQTTVLFADIAGFTAWAQRTNPAQVVEILDDLFSRFDALAETHGVEKIKTIGDSYMAVAGAPEPRADHAATCLALAEEMLAEAETWRHANDVALRLRVGLASGPVVGGVIGERRILFDLWGDTVNLAARMESSGVAGQVQVSEATWSLLLEQARFERREIEAKGFGITPAYLLRETGSP